MEEKTKNALLAIKSSHGTEAGEYGATLFVSHHLEELEPSCWVKHTGSELPSPEEVLNLLVVQEVWSDGSAIDFTLPDEVTNYLLSVSLNENDGIDDISMES